MKFGPESQNGNFPTGEAISTDELNQNARRLIEEFVSVLGNSSQFQDALTYRHFHTPQKDMYAPLTFEKDEVQYGVDYQSDENQTLLHVFKGRNVLEFDEHIIVRIGRGNTIVEHEKKDFQDSFSGITRGSRAAIAKVEQFLRELTTPVI